MRDTGNGRGPGAAPLAMTPRAEIPARIAAYVIRAATLLVLPLALLLAAQWPMRDVFTMTTTHVNDYAQVAFAFVALSGIVAAMLQDRHVRLESWSARWSVPWRARIEAAGLLLLVLPWLALLARSSIPFVAQSVRQFERFPDTDTPGYFLIRVALALFLVTFALAVLSRLLHALREARGGRD